jgi:hypothetical protein
MSHNGKQLPPVASAPAACQSYLDRQIKDNILLQQMKDNILLHDIIVCVAGVAGGAVLGVLRR